MTKIVNNNTAIDEPLEKRYLERAISEKERLLIVVLEKVEQLKIDLSVLKQEYDIKIGRLYLRLDEINMEILRFKKIKDLLDRGFSFSEAHKNVMEKLKKQRDHIKEENHKLDEEEKGFKSRKIISSDKQRELKKLWRKLAQKYHPDLKHGKEKMMKKINKAYTEGDLETLRTIDREQSSEDIETATIEGLKAKLASIEKSIEKANGEFEVMRMSEWFILKQNIKNAADQKRDLLAELSDKVLTDIARKDNQLKELRNKYGKG